jgi:hypothetical protein
MGGKGGGFGPLLTINVPDVFMAWYIMVLRGATSLLGALEGVGLKISTFLGPEMARAKRVPFGPIRPTPSNALSNDVAPLKTIMYKRHKNNWYIGSFMYPNAVVYCCCVLLCVVVCCCVLEGRGGLPVAVLCEQVGAGWQESPSPTHYSVGIHGCMLVGGGVL